MSKLVRETKQALRQAVLDAMGKAVADGALPPEPFRHSLWRSPRTGPMATMRPTPQWHVQRLSTWPHAKLRRKF